MTSDLHCVTCGQGKGWWEDEECDGCVDLQVRTGRNYWGRPVDQVQALALQKQIRDRKEAGR